MAVWERLTAKPGFERIKSMYNESLPIEVRCVCAEWIEQQMKLERCFDIHNDPNIEQRAANFIRSLIEQLNHKKTQFISDPSKVIVLFRIETAVCKYSNILYNPYATYKYIREVIMYEQKCVEINDGNVSICNDDKEAADINEKLQSLHNSVLAIKEKQAHLTHEQEQFQALEYNENVNVTEVYTTMLETDVRRIRSIEEYQNNRQIILGKIEGITQMLSDNLNETLTEIDKVQKVVITNRLGRWHRNQALICNGTVFPLNDLDEIQEWFKKLADLICMTRTTIDALRKQNRSNNNIWSTYYGLNNKLLQMIIVSGFIVEKQPPRVLKKHTIFAAQVRMLTTNVGIHLKSPTVKVSILSEVQVRQLFNNRLALGKPSGEILNNDQILDMQRNHDHLACPLNNMQLKQITRSERRSTVSVMEEKFALLFEATFDVADVKIVAWVLSLPVVVTVHNNQDPLSWATIMWDNAFAEISRMAFVVPEKVVWSRLAETLNTKFASQTGRNLTDDNLHYLCEKALRQIEPNANAELTWSQFCKVTFDGCLFTFWEWFYANMKLTSNQLREHWTNSLIIGFISKRHTEEMLKSRPAGTFLLRFSDSEIGGITIAFVETTSDQKRIVKMFQPFTAKDFGIRSLADRIMDLPQCVALYPDIPKAIAFGNYYTKPDEKPVNHNGYVKVGLKAFVGNDNTNAITSNPSTLDQMQETPLMDSVFSSPNPTPSAVPVLFNSPLTVQQEPVLEVNGVDLQTIWEDLSLAYSEDIPMDTDMQGQRSGSQ